MNLYISREHLDFDHLEAYCCLFYRVVTNHRLSSRQVIGILQKVIYQQCREFNSKNFSGDKPPDPYFLSLSLWKNALLQKFEPL